MLLKICGQLSTFKGFFCFEEKMFSNCCLLCQKPWFKVKAGMVLVGVRANIGPQKMNINHCDVLSSDRKMTECMYMHEGGPWISSRLIVALMLYCECYLKKLITSGDVFACCF